MRVAGLRWLKVRVFPGGGGAPAADRPTPMSETTVGRRSSVRRGAAGLLATALVTGSFVGLSTTVASAATIPACTTHVTGTCVVTLTMTSGSFGVHGNTAAVLPPPGIGYG